MFLVFENFKQISYVLDLDYCVLIISSDYVHLINYMIDSLIG